MNKRLIVAIIAVIIVLGVIAGYLASHSQATTSSTSSSSTNNAAPSTSSPDQKTGGTSVAIENFAFSPKTLTIAKGTSVTWTNKDSAAHTVSESDGKKGPDSPSLAQNANYSFTFDTPGTYQYRCTFHPSMTATVVVTD